MMQMQEGILEHFAKKLIPPPEKSLTRANVAMDKVFKLLQRKSKFSLDRFILGGSTGKRTFTQSFDYDCVVFINDELPSFENVIDEFAEILNMAQSLDIKFLKTTPYSVQFGVGVGPNNIQFDLLPAANLIKNLNNVSSEHRIKEQQKCVIDIIERASFNSDLNKFKNLKKLYSSSLVESHVQFMKKQNAFTHELARLAKYWDKTLLFEDYINGRSTIIELIAVDAAIKTVAKYQKANFTNGFLLFLDLMTKLDGIRLTFANFWPPIKNKPIIDGYNCPVILEPNNPYNNMGVSLTESIRKKYKLYATETIKRMKSWNTWDGKHIFVPQPQAQPPEGTGIKVPRYYIKITGAKPLPVTW